MPESLKGRCLVAVPGMEDPNFARTVVLLLEHGEQGALGLVLNRPSETRVGEILPAWEPVAAAPAVVFIGGPVVPGGAIGLARGADEAVEGWVPLLGSTGTVDLERDPADLSVPVDVVRVFAGHAGWGPGQLEGELAANGWFALDPAPDDVFTSDPGSLWRTILRRAGGRYEMFANYPADPSAN